MTADRFNALIYTEYSVKETHILHIWYIKWLNWWLNTDLMIYVRYH